MNDEPTAFIYYWNAVDDALLRFFGIDTADAGMDADLIAGAQEEGQTPEDFARWYGNKYDLEGNTGWGVKFADISVDIRNVTHYGSE